MRWADVPVNSSKNSNDRLFKGDLDTGKYLLIINTGNSQVGNRVRVVR